MTHPGADRSARPVSVRALVAQFTVAGLIVMAVLATVIAFLARQAGTDQAVESARQVTWVAARGIVEPRLDDAVVADDPVALTRFNDAMRQYVLQGSLVRVKLWAADGHILYSDEPRLVGQSFDLDEEELQALANRSTASEISDLDAPENEFDRPYGKLLEVYAGVRSTSGQPLLFEAYFRYDAVTQAGGAQWRKYAPPTLGGLLALQLVQIPLAYSLARRLQRQQRERQRLLQHAVEASDAERRRIAGDLHDGVVQQLTGLTYALDAARLGPADPVRDADLVRSAAGQLRGSVGDLRSLLVDIYPPNLAEEGLPGALADLADELERSGVSVTLDVEGADRLPLQVAAVLFRGAQEVVRNVVAHSGARSVWLQAATDGPVARLSVEDDGVGFDRTDVDRQLTAGHIGLRSIGDLVASSGGQLTVRSQPGAGTRVEIVLPTASLDLEGAR